MEILLFVLRFLVGAAVLLVPGILTAALLRDGEDDDSPTPRADGAAAPEQTTVGCRICLRHRPMQRTRFPPIHFAEDRRNLAILRSDDILGIAAPGDIEGEGRRRAWDWCSMYAILSGGSGNRQWPVCSCLLPVLTSGSSGRGSARFFAAWVTKT